MAYNHQWVVSQLPTFTALPAEIRNKIYGYLCHNAAPLRLYFYQDPESTTPKPVILFARNTVVPVAFFLTCRQLYAEASSVFYSENVFLFNRRTRYASLIKPCFISALLRFFHVVGSRATLVRNVVFDTFSLYNSVFLRTYIDKTTRFFDPLSNIVEVTVLLHYAWKHELNFKINLIDVANVEKDRAAYWMRNPDLVRTTTVIAIINSLLDGQLDLKQFRNSLQAVAIKRDGSGGLICWVKDPPSTNPCNLLRLYTHTLNEFVVKDSGTQLELVPLRPSLHCADFGLP